MASNNTTLEYVFVEKPPEDCFCPVTQEVLKDPQKTNFCCGNHLSRTAVDRLKQEGKPCPICGSTPLKATDDPRLKRRVLALKVRCSNIALGCKWVGELGQLEEHMKIGSAEGICEYTSVPCPYKCGYKIQRRSLGVHKSKECSHRPFSCEYCGYRATYKEVIHDHWPRCQKYPLKCPNQCFKVVERRFLKCHLDQDCPLQEIECKFSYAGCGAKMQRKKMQEHMVRSKSKHLSILATYEKTVLEQFEKQVHALEVAFNKFGSQPISILPTVIVLDNFEQRKTKNCWWFSPSFYTHVGGYKMCVRARASEVTYSQDTFVSVYLIMMRGKYDDHLQWPFEGVVTVQLINQREGGEHVAKKFESVNAESENTLCRVMVGDMAERGWAGIYFIPCLKLYEPDKGKEYLKNDTLKFRVTAVTEKGI